MAFKGFIHKVHHFIKNALLIVKKFLYACVGNPVHFASPAR